MGTDPFDPIYNEKTKFLSQSGAEILTRPLLRRGCAIRDGANLFRSSSNLLCSFVMTVRLYSKQFLVTSVTSSILLGDLFDLNYHIITCEKTTPTLSLDQ